MGRLGHAFGMLKNSPVQAAGALLTLLVQLGLAGYVLFLGDPGGEEESMPVRFNHTIVAAKDKVRSAQFLAELLGLPEPERAGHFVVVKAGGWRVARLRRTRRRLSRPALRVPRVGRRLRRAIAKIRERGILHWADPRGSTPGRSTPTTAGAGSTPGSRRGITWKPSRSPTAAVTARSGRVDSRPWALLRIPGREERAAARASLHRAAPAPAVAGAAARGRSPCPRRSRRCGWRWSACAARLLRGEARPFEDADVEAALRAAGHARTCGPCSTPPAWCCTPTWAARRWPPRPWRASPRWRRGLLQPRVRPGRGRARQPLRARRRPAARAHRRRGRARGEQLRGARCCSCSPRSPRAARRSSPAASWWRSAAASASRT